MSARGRWAVRLALLGVATLALSAGLHALLERPPPPAPVGQVALVLAAHDIPAGRVLSMDDLYMREFPALPETRLCVRADEALSIVGKAPRLDLKQGAPIYRDDLTAGPP